MMQTQNDAVPYLAKAHEALSQDVWLVEKEPARLKWLKELIS